MYKEIVSYGIIGDTTTSKERVKADEDKRVGYLSSIFKWYFNDSGETKEDILNYILKFLNRNSKFWLEKNIKKVKIKHLPYDWNLNGKTNKEGL